MSEALKTGEVKFGETLNFKIITRDDMARLALWSLRYALDGDRDARAVRAMLTNLARSKMLQPQDIAVIIEDVRMALSALATSTHRQNWEGFIRELEELI